MNLQVFISNYGSVGVVPSAAIFADLRLNLAGFSCC